MTASRLRPLARRFLNTFRPPGVSIRARKPCRLRRHRLLGWYVLFTVFSRCRRLSRIREGRRHCRSPASSNSFLDPGRDGRPPRRGKSPGPCHRGPWMSISAVNLEASAPSPWGRRSELRLQATAEQARQRLFGGEVFVKHAIGDVDDRKLDALPGSQRFYGLRVPNALGHHAHAG